MRFSSSHNLFFDSGFFLLLAIRCMFEDNATLGLAQEVNFLPFAPALKPNLSENVSVFSASKQNST